jgi:hypothetical protein
VSHAFRAAPFSFVVSSCIAWLILATGPANGDTRHHISIGLGYSKLTSNDVKGDSLGADFSNAGNGALAYRFTLNHAIDLTVDSRGTASKQSTQGVDVWLLNSFFGPGVRWHPAIGGGAHPYLQGSFFLVSEEVQVQQAGVKVSTSQSSGGFGVFGGVDLALSHLLSLPLEVNYLYAKPADDVSSFGFTVSLAFNFGEMK